MKWPLLAFVVGSALSLAGCALFAKPGSLSNAVQQAEPVLQHSTAVLQCAAVLQHSATEAGKAVPTATVLAFCAAVEASPDVPRPAPAPVTPGVI
jgi:hypothetical protein